MNKNNTRSKFQFHNFQKSNFFISEKSIQRRHFTASIIQDEATFITVS